MNNVHTILDNIWICREMHDFLALGDCQQLWSCESLHFYKTCAYIRSFNSYNILSYSCYKCIFLSYLTWTSLCNLNVLDHIPKTHQPRGSFKFKSWIWVILYDKYLNYWFHFNFKICWSIYKNVVNCFSCYEYENMWEIGVTRIHVLYQNHVIIRDKDIHNGLIHTFVMPLVFYPFLFLFFCTISI